MLKTSRRISHIVAIKKKSYLKIIKYRKKMMTPVTCNTFKKSKDFLKIRVMFEVRRMLKHFRNHQFDQVVAHKRKIEKLNQEIEICSWISLMKTFKVCRQRSFKSSHSPKLNLLLTCLYLHQVQKK